MILIKPKRPVCQYHKSYNGGAKSYSMFVVTRTDTYIVYKCPVCGTAEKVIIA